MTQRLMVAAAMGLLASCGEGERQQPGTHGQPEGGTTQDASAATRPVTDLISETTTSRARAGNSSMRFLSKPTPTADWPSGEPTHRNELDPDGNRDYLPPKGEERWYGLSLFFPDDFVFAPAAIASNLRFIVAQWQHGTVGSPAVSFEVMGEER